MLVLAACSTCFLKRRKYLFSTYSTYLEQILYSKKYKKNNQSYAHIFMDALNKDLNRLVKLSSDYTFLSFQSYICYKTKNKLPEKPSLRCYAFSFYVFRQRQNGFSWLTASCIMERKLNSLFVFISSTRHMHLC